MSSMRCKNMLIWFWWIGNSSSMSWISELLIHDHKRAAWCPKNKEKPQWEQRLWSICLNMMAKVPCHKDLRRMHQIDHLIIALQQQAVSSLKEDHQMYHHKEFRTQFNNAAAQALQRMRSTWTRQEWGPSADKSLRIQSIKHFITSTNSSGIQCSWPFSKAIYISSSICQQNWKYIYVAQLQFQSANVQIMKSMHHHCCSVFCAAWWTQTIPTKSRYSSICGRALISFGTTSVSSMLFWCCWPSIDQTLWILWWSRGQCRASSCRFRIISGSSSCPDSLMAFSISQMVTRNSKKYSERT